MNTLLEYPNELRDEVLMMMDYESIRLLFTMASLESNRFQWLLDIRDSPFFWKNKLYHDIKPNNLAGEGFPLSLPPQQESTYLFNYVLSGQMSPEMYYAFCQIEQCHFNSLLPEIGAGSNLNIMEILLGYRDYRMIRKDFTVDGSSLKLSDLGSIVELEERVPITWDDEWEVESREAFRIIQRFSDTGQEKDFMLLLASLQRTIAGYGDEVKRDNLLSDLFVEIGKRGIKLPSKYSNNKKFLWWVIGWLLSGHKVPSEYRDKLNSTLNHKINDNVLVSLVLGILVRFDPENLPQELPALEKGKYKYGVLIPCLMYNVPVPTYNVVSKECYLKLFVIAANSWNLPLALEMRKQFISYFASLPEMIENGITISGLEFLQRNGEKLNETTLHLNFSLIANRIIHQKGIMYYDIAQEMLFELNSDRHNVIHPRIILLQIVKYGLVRTLRVLAKHRVAPFEFEEIPEYLQFINRDLLSGGGSYNYSDLPVTEEEYRWICTQLTSGQ